MAEKPADPEIRSHFVEALTEWGYGFFLKMCGRQAEARQPYHRAIELSRQLALDPGLNATRRLDELKNTLGLTTVLVPLLDGGGQSGEAQQLYRDLISTCSTLEGMLAGSQSKIQRVAANAHNNLAWLLATVPDVSYRNPPQALEEAREAVTLVPGEATFWNTLGVAAYRAGDWKRASEALEKSMSLHQGGDANDWFFLAMTRWRQNQPSEALKWFEKASDWTKKNQPMNPELQRFQAEAQGLLGIAKQAPESTSAVKS